ncbi:uncharacterized protein K02A2.6-like [Ornithodoros turicata]|uniref:uncharacterized protein K02A2.6-like n=1 Tax=Ornithodoros turicata TaxID=34597 RepID=UPI003139E37C
MPPPTQVSELRAFLGMIQHYAKYLQSMWSASSVDAFEAIKKMLTSAQILTHYDPRKEIFLAVDASSKGLGAVIYHRHTGQTKMNMLARSYVSWPKVDKDIETLSRGCEQCAEFSEQKLPMPIFTAFSLRFCRVQGHHFLIAIDAYTTLQEIFVQQGFPEQIVIDNGPTFMSSTLKEFIEQHGIQHTLTAPYHPKSNGQAENFVRTFKTALRRGGTKEEAIQSFVVQYGITPHANYRANTIHAPHGKTTTLRPRPHPVWLGTTFPGSKKPTEGKL